jgi:hypothetical protein
MQNISKDLLHLILPNIINHYIVQVFEIKANCYQKEDQYLYQECKMDNISQATNYDRLHIHFHQ